MESSVILFFVLSIC